jgi:hypothetical protein
MSKTKPTSKPSHLTLVPSDAGGPDAQPPSPRPPGRSIPWGLGVVLVAVLALGGGIGYFGSHRTSAAAQPPEAEDPEAAGPPLGFELYVHPNSNPAAGERAGDGDTISASDGFTFVLHNRTLNSTWFMLFGADTSNTFFWFYPEADPAKVNASLPLPPTPVSTLPEGVTPAGVAPGRLRVVALFTPDPVTVQQVEAAFARGGPEGIQTDLHAQMQVLTLAVE